MNFELIADTTQSRVGNGIIGKAEKLGVELIVAGARDKEKEGLGSVSSHIVGNSKIPILIWQEKVEPDLETAKTPELPVEKTKH